MLTNVSLKKKKFTQNILILLVVNPQDSRKMLKNVLVALFHAIAFEWGMNHKHGPVILGTKHKVITVNS